MNVVDSSPLPALNSKLVRKSALSYFSNRYSVYRRVLEAEKHAVRKGKQEFIVAARVVGCVLLEFHAQRNIFGDTPCSALCRWVTSLSRDESNDPLDIVYNVGMILRDRFVGLFRVFSDQDTSFSARPSRPSFDRLEDMIADSLAVSSDDCRTSRKKVLARDGYQCMVTNIVDMNSLARCVELRAIVLRDRLPSGPVQTAYILNKSTLRRVDRCVVGDGSAVGDKIHGVAGPLDILQLFGFSDVVDAIGKPGGVHQSWNLLSLNTISRFHFDNQLLWFERTNKEHCYNIRLDSKGNEAWVCAARGGEAGPMVVDFTPKVHNVPPPKPTLLDLHATCARVAHRSGAAHFFDRLQLDAEETDVLASDGSSAMMLDGLSLPFLFLG